MGEESIYTQYNNANNNLKKALEERIESDKYVMWLMRTNNMRHLIEEAAFTSEEYEYIKSI